MATAELVRQSKTGILKPRTYAYKPRGNEKFILSRLGGHKAWLECYAMAREQKKVDVMVTILRYLTDRRDGRAPVADSPSSSQSQPMVNDNRLQLAIQSLIVHPHSKAAERKLKQAVIAGESVLPDSQTGSDDSQPIQAAAQPGGGE